MRNFDLWPHLLRKIPWRLTFSVWFSERSRHDEHFEILQAYFCSNYESSVAIFYIVLIDIVIFHFLGGRVGFLATTQKLFDIELSSRFQMKAKRYGQFLKSLTSWFFRKCTCDILKCLPQKLKMQENNRLFDIIY